MNAPFDPPVSGTAQQNPTPVPVLPMLPNPSAGGVAAPPAHDRPAPDFDARAMVDSQRAKVARPAYGDLPGGDGPANQAAIETARRLMLQKRRRNDRFVRSVMLVLALIVAVAGAGLYLLFQAGEDTPADDPVRTTVAAQQEQVGNAGLDAVDDARRAVDEVNGNSGAQP